MSKSISARLTSEVLELFSMYMNKNSDKLIEDALQKGEHPSPPPLVPNTRFEDHENGRVFYANEDSKSGITVFYLHGGAYFMDFALAHWKLIKKNTNPVIRFSHWHRLSRVQIIGKGISIFMIDASVRFMETLKVSAMSQYL